MTKEYRDRELEAATREMNAARLRYDSAKTKSARISADEDLQFWGSRVANLSQVV